MVLGAPKEQFMCIYHLGNCKGCSVKARSANFSAGPGLWQDEVGVNHSQPRAVGGLRLRALAPACESLSNSPRGESRDIYLKGGKSLNWVTAGRIRCNTHFYVGYRNTGGTNCHASFSLNSRPSFKPRANVTMDCYT